MADVKGTLWGNGREGQRQKGQSRIAGRAIAFGLAVTRLRNSSIAGFRTGHITSQVIRRRVSPSRFINKTSRFIDKTGHIGDKTTHLIDKTSRIGEKTTRPINKTTHLGDRTTSLLDKMTRMGDKPTRFTDKTS